MEFCNTYGGSDGGELSSRLAMYPFLMQVRSHGCSRRTAVTMI